MAKTPLGDLGQSRVFRPDFYASATRPMITG